MPFQKGRSGNPNGRPPGSRNKKTLAIEALLAERAEVLTQKAIALAEAGNPLMLRLCLERIYPARREPYSAFPLSNMKNAADAAKVQAQIAAGVVAGDLTAKEASELGRFVTSYAQAIEVADLEGRIQRMEKIQKDAASR